ETVKILYDLDKGLVAMRRGLKMLREAKRYLKSVHVLTVLQTQSQTWTFKHPVSAKNHWDNVHVQHWTRDFTNINVTWSSLDSVIYISTVEAGITFEIPNHFDAIIGISNIKTGVHIEAFTQMLYQIQNCLQHIISLYNRLSVLRSIDLPIAVKGYREWDKIADCYALDASSAVETYIEAEY
ncbi:1532_t:CDS:2, partial [Funneliformis geosporum]